jgi:hypothetical protein
MKVDPCEKKIRKYFFNYYNRPNLTPIHTSVIQRKLEERYPPWKVNDTLKKLEREDVLSSMEIKTKYGAKILFYFPKKNILNYNDEEKIIAKIKRITNYINKYSNQKITNILGEHLHALVKYELRVQGFEIIDEYDVNSYKGRELEGSQYTMDLLAKHKEKNLIIGVEVKNELDIMDKSELDIKLKLCKKLKITPIFACRWLNPYKQKIVDSGGFLWQFKTQMYPLGFETFTKSIKQKFGFPVKVTTEIPEKQVSEFEEWLKTK